MAVRGVGGRSPRQPARIARRLAGFDETGETGASQNANSCKQDSSSDGVGGAAAAPSAEQQRYRRRQPRLGLPVPDRGSHDDAVHAPTQMQVSAPWTTSVSHFARSGARRRPNSAEPSAQAPGTERCRGGSGKQLPPPCARLSNRRCAEEDQGGHERRHRWVIEMLAVKRVAAVR